MCLPFNQWELYVPPALKINNCDFCKKGLMIFNLNIDNFLKQH